MRLAISGQFLLAGVQSYVIKPAIVQAAKDIEPSILIARPSQDAFAKMVLDYLYSGAVVCLPMAVRTERNRILGNISAAVSKPSHVVDLQERATIRLVKGGTLAAQFATTLGALQNPALDLGGRDQRP